MPHLIFKPAAFAHLPWCQSENFQRYSASKSKERTFHPYFKEIEQRKPKVNIKMSPPHQDFLAKSFSVGLRYSWCHDWWLYLINYFNFQSTCIDSIPWRWDSGWYHDGWKVGWIKKWWIFQLFSWPFILFSLWYSI